MERNNRGFGTTPEQRKRFPMKGLNASGRFDPLNPASRKVNRSLRAAEFDHFSRVMQRDLNPHGPLEALVVRQAIRSAWRLQTNLDAEADTLLAAVATNDGDRAARSLEVALTTLDLLQGRREEAVEPMFEPEDQLVEPNEWPILPSRSSTSDAADDLEDSTGATADEPPIWSGRLMYDFDVSDHSPVVKGTWITVSHIVSLIVDGATWADILRTHPELSEQDLRMCVAYAVAEDSATL